MKIYVMTDSHLGHTAILKHGIRKEGFEQEIYNGIMSLPKDTDMIIHLGDVCIGEDEKNHIDLLIRLKARAKRAILVLGNHDGHSDSWYYNKGWDFVCRGFVMKHFGKRFMFTHKPVEVHDGEQEENWLNIHGHLHGAWKESHRGEDWLIENFHIDVAPETHGYTPIALDKLIPTCDTI
jgi:calcineurin-like phosphoesterase family protein